MNCAKMICRFLEKCNVDKVFGVPGYANSAIYVASDDSVMVDAITAKHEGGGAWMAYGYTMAGREFGVCSSTSGPGVANTVSAVYAAFANSAPVLVLSGQADTNKLGKNAFQEISSKNHRVPDIMQIMSTMTKMNVMLDNPASLQETLAQAYFALTTGRRGPVHINIPCDVLLSECPDIDFSFIENKKESFTEPTPKLDEFIKLKSMLKESKFPLVLVGRGCLRSAEKVEVFIKKVNLPFATTIQSKGLIKNSSINNLGMIGMLGSLRARQYIEDLCDTIIVLGSSLNEFSTYGLSDWVFDNKKLIRVDIDELEFEKNYIADLNIHSDVTQFISAFEKLLNYDFETSYDADLTAAYLSKFPICKQVETAPHIDRKVMPYDVIKLLNEFAPENTLFLGDSGNAAIWGIHYLELKGKQNFMQDMNSGCMGSAIMASIGAKLANPGRPVVAICGDGTFMMNAMEIHTAAEHNVPIVWLVLNDHKYSVVQQGDTNRFGNSVGATFKNVNVAEIAKGYGADAILIESTNSLEKIFKNLSTLTKPLVLDVRINELSIPKVYDRAKKAKKASTQNSNLEHSNSNK